MASAGLDGLGVLASLASFVVAGRALGNIKWARGAGRLAARLEAAGFGDTPGGTIRPSRYDVRELEGLPEPVQRYFRAVLRDGQPLMTKVTIDMVGRFNLSSTGEHWKPFSSHQHVTARRPGFVWDASIDMPWALDLRVVDSYIAGEGLLHAAVLGFSTVARRQGDGDFARGELVRWLAEAPWYPTALLPGQGVHWEPVDATCAKATLTDGVLSVTLTFRFDAAGLITGFRTESRGSMIGSRLVMAPWEGVWSDYRWVNGMCLPFRGAVAWVRPDGRRPYFVGSVTAMAFEDPV